SADWWERERSKEDARFPSIRWLGVINLCAVLMQLVLGAGFRHGAFAIMPHVVGALVVATFVIWTALTVLHRFSSDTHLRRLAEAMLVLLFCQIGLGVLAYVARVNSQFDAQPLEPMISLTVGHVVVGALILGSAVALTLRCWRALSASRQRIRGTQVCSSSSGEA